MVDGEENIDVVVVVVDDEIDVVAKGDSSPRIKKILNDRLSTTATTESNTGVVDGATAATVADMIRNKLSSLLWLLEACCCALVVALVHGFFLLLLFKEGEDCIIICRLAVVGTMAIRGETPGVEKYPGELGVVLVDEVVVVESNPGCCFRSSSNCCCCCCLCRRRIRTCCSL